MMLTYSRAHVFLQITDLGPDANECCMLARTLALHLTEGLPGGTIALPNDGKDNLTHSPASVDWGPGESDV